MIPFPDPVHPAVVHFPVALLLVGALVSVAAVFVRRWHLPLFAAMLLSAGAAGAVAAVATGEAEEERVQHAVPSAEPLLEEHSQRGERARNFGVGAAALSIVAAIVASGPWLGRTLSIFTALSACAAAYCVVQAGHFGGELVYRHGAGVEAKSGQTQDAGEEESVPARASPGDDD